MATPRSVRVLLAALTGWAVFGAWALFRPEADVPGVDPLVGHVVVFFFVSLAAYGLAMRPLGIAKGVAVGSVAMTTAAGVSEVLQPIVTETRQAQLGDLAANGLGIAGAIAASVILAAVVRTPALREVATAVLCLIGLAGSVTLLGVGADRVRVELECRGQGLEPLASVNGAPIIRVVGETVVTGSGGEQSLVDGTVAADSADLRCSVMRFGRYSIVATVVPATTEVGGPMRIFTSSVSTNINLENTHLGQDFDALSIRVKTNGELQLESVPDVFVAGERATVAMTVGDGQIVVFVDGERRASFDLDGDSFSEWDASYPMLIGDEFTRDRTFQGAIEAVLVFDRMLDEGDPSLAGVSG